MLDTRFEHDTLFLVFEEDFRFEPPGPEDDIPTVGLRPAGAPERGPEAARVAELIVGYPSHILLGV